MYQVYVQSCSHNKTVGVKDEIRFRGYALVSQQYHQTWYCYSLYCYLFSSLSYSYFMNYLNSVIFIIFMLYCWSLPEVNCSKECWNLNFSFEGMDSLMNSHVACRDETRSLVWWFSLILKYSTHLSWFTLSSIIFFVQLPENMSSMIKSAINLQTTDW